MTDFNNGSGDRAYDIAIQTDGKIVIAGLSTSKNDDFAIARYNADGTLDTTFGIGGKVVTDFNAFSDYALSLAIQPDGNIIAAGITSDGINPTDFALARYLP